MASFRFNPKYHISQGIRHDGRILNADNHQMSTEENPDDFTYATLTSKNPMNVVPLLVSYKELDAAKEAPKLVNENIAVVEPEGKTTVYVKDLDAQVSAGNGTLRHGF